MHNIDLGEKIVQSTEINAGTNNKLFKIKTESDKVFLLKQYIKDERERLDREFTAFSFLVDKGFENVPKAILRDDDQNIAVYEYIEGVSKKADQITKKDLDCFVDFLVDLHNIRPESTDQKFRPALFDTLKLENYLHSIDKRYDELKKDLKQGVAHELVQEAVKDIKLDQLIETIKQEAYDKFGKEVLNKELPVSERRLSPVDFGIHNAIYRNDNKVTFIDFEYSGWDDPVGILVEFLNHVANKGLSIEFFNYFIKEYKSKAKPSDKFMARFEISNWLNDREWIAIFAYSMTELKMSHRRHGIQNFDQEQYLKNMIKKLKTRIQDLGY